MDAPILDLELADQLFAVAGEAEAADVRAMLAEFESDVAPRFAELKRQSAATDGNATEAKRGLHGLRGVVANFAFARGAARLRTLETEWLTLLPAERSDQLRLAEADVQAGMRALRQRLPHLN